MSRKKNIPSGNEKAYLKYIGLSFQLFSIIGLGTWLGWYFQQKSTMKFPLWLMLGFFVSTFIAFYQLYISSKNDSN
jgi:hypothetical protein